LLKNLELIDISTIFVAIVEMVALLCLKMCRFSTHLF